MKILLTKSGKQFSISDDNAKKVEEVRKSNLYDRDYWIDLGNSEGTSKGEIKGIFNDREADAEKVKSNNDDYYKKIDEAWRKEMTTEKNKSLEDKIEKSVFIAKVLLDCVNEKITPEIELYVRSESAKFFKENDKTFYPQSWFTAYLRKHNKKMSLIASAVAIPIIKTIKNANLYV